MMLFIYHLLPTAIFQIILLIGVLGTTLSAFLPTIPLVGQYQFIFKAISIACLVLGLVWYGIDDSETQWKAQNESLALQVKTLEARAPEITKEIVVQYVDRVKIIKQKGDTIVKNVPVYVTTESDRRCPVPAGLVRLLNDAARTQVPDTTGGTNATGTGTTPTAGATGKSK